MPVAMISTSTSPCFGPSRSTSTISSGCLAAKATAARVFMMAPPGSDGRLAQQEAPNPPADACIVVGRVERGDGGVGIGHPVVALGDQRLGEVGREVRMELERERRAIGPRQARVRREVGRGDDLGVRRPDYDLVLVRGGNRDVLGFVQPWLGVEDRIMMES